MFASQYEYDLVMKNLSPVKPLKDNLCKLTKMLIFPSDSWMLQKFLGLRFNKVSK